MKAGTIVFIHGMYMNSLCWEHWIPYFELKGYTCLVPDWPGRGEPVSVLRQKHPDPVLSQLSLHMVVESISDKINLLNEKPIIIGHSMGGLVVQLLLQQDLAAAGVAIDSAPPAGVFSTQWSFLKSNWPHITPFVSLNQPIAMTFERFQYAFVNGLPLDEQQAAYDRYVVPESRRVPRESLTAGIDFKKTHAPLLLVGGSADNIIPASLNRSNCARYKQTPSIIEYLEFQGRTHFIIGQKNWEEVADSILTWLEDKGV